MIKIVELTHSRLGAKPLFRGLNLSLKEGNFYAFCGPSGSGKSTLLRLIAGLEQPSKGQVKVNQRRVAVMFQEPGLLPWRTVEENLALVSEVSSTIETETKPALFTPELCKQTLESVRLQPEVGKLYPHQLSGGMKARVALARALLAAEKLLVLDEPFSALDEVNQLALHLEVRRIHKEKGLTTILVTHSVSEAVFLADEIFILNDYGGLKGSIQVQFNRERTLALLTDPCFHSKMAEVREQLLKGPTNEVFRQGFKKT